MYQMMPLVVNLPEGSLLSHCDCDDVLCDLSFCDLYSKHYEHTHHHHHYHCRYLKKIHQISWALNKYSNLKIIIMIKIINLHDFKLGSVTSWRQFKSSFKKTFVHFQQYKLDSWTPSFALQELDPLFWVEGLEKYKWSVIYNLHFDVFFPINSLSTALSSHCTFLSAFGFFSLSTSLCCCGFNQYYSTMRLILYCHTLLICHSTIHKRN